MVEEVAARLAGRGTKRKVEVGNIKAGTAVESLSHDRNDTHHRSKERNEGSE